MGAASLTGNTSLAAVAGVASPSLNIDTVGTGYTLRANGAALPQATWRYP